jgi:hypothetical protein
MDEFHGAKRALVEAADDRGAFGVHEEAMALESERSGLIEDPFVLERLQRRGGGGGLGRSGGVGNGGSGGRGLGRRGHLLLDKAEPGGVDSDREGDSEE